jgi:hypothetical protein
MGGGDDDDKRGREGTRNDGNWQRVNQKEVSLASEGGIRAYAKTTNLEINT